MKRFFMVSLLVVAALVAPSVPAAPRAQAAPMVGPFTVDSTLDEVDSDTADGLCQTDANECTLRAAVMQANTVSGAGVTIILPSGTYTLTRPAAGPDPDYNGDLNLATPTTGLPIITIQGAGAATTIIDAAGLDRVFHVESGRTAIVSGVTIQGGFVYLGSGGGVQNDGTLTLSQSIVTDNESDFGGGIANFYVINMFDSLVNGNRAINGGGVYTDDGPLYLTRTTIRGNQASEEGGGLMNLASASLKQSTVNNNSAIEDGGGIHNDGALFLINSTVSQNSVNENGGGIYANNPSSANIYNSTIVFNGADADFDKNGGNGGGFFNEPGATISIRNTLVAGNIVHGFPVYEDCYGTLGSYGQNLIGLDADSVDCTVSIGSGDWDYLNSLALLGPLADNGGLTQTHALRLGSNAIDGTDPSFPCTDENSAALLTDQRGAARLVGDLCDIGAFEYRPPLFLPLLQY